MLNGCDAGGASEPPLAEITPQPLPTRFPTATAPVAPPALPANGRRPPPPPRNAAQLDVRGHVGHLEEDKSSVLAASSRTPTSLGADLVTDGGGHHAQGYPSQFEDFLRA